MEIQVTNNTAQQQFEVHAEGELAMLQYRFHEGAIWMMHTEVPKNWKGRELRRPWHIMVWSGQRKMGYP